MLWTVYPVYFMNSFFVLCCLSISKAPYTGKKIYIKARYTYHKQNGERYTQSKADGYDNKLMLTNYMH